MILCKTLAINFHQTNGFYMIIKKLLIQVFGKYGFTVRRRLPVFAQNPDIVLQVTFDMLINHLHSSLGRELTVLQVGAFDGSTGDRVFPWVAKGIIKKGLLLEPQEVPFSKLRKCYEQYPDIILGNWALGIESGSSEMYRIKQVHVDNHPELLQLTSFDKSVFNKYLTQYGIKDNDPIEKKIVKVVSPSDVFSILGLNNVDCLVVDAEGYDAKLVNCIISAGYRPALICFESCNLAHNEISDLVLNLSRLGYRFQVDSIDILCFNV